MKPGEYWADLSGDELVAALRKLAHYPSPLPHSAALMRASDVIKLQAREIEQQADRRKWLDGYIAELEAKIEQQAQRIKELETELDQIEYSHDLDLRSARSHAEWMARED